MSKRRDEEESVSENSELRDLNELYKDIYFGKTQHLGSM